MAPALLFLCAGVPLAALLDRLGFFDSVAVTIERRWDHVPVSVLWWLAAATTAVLNLDTTIVLLTPLYVRLARRTDGDPLGLALIPLVLASAASSVLPVSNLTTLIAVERFDVPLGAVVARLGPVSAAACVVAWLAYRRRWPSRLASSGSGAVDRRALVVGSTVVVGLLVGFVIGPGWGVDPWLVVLLGDLALVVVTRFVPWREVPIATALGVSLVAAAVAVLAPATTLESVLAADGPLRVGGIVIASAALANVVNNLPALLLGLDAVESMTPGAWAWLAGTNTGASLLPFGALANLLWWRIARDEGVSVDLRSYVRTVVPVALPSLLAGAAVLALLSTTWA